MSRALEGYPGSLMVLDWPSCLVAFGACGEEAGLLVRKACGMVWLYQQRMASLQRELEDNTATCQTQQRMA